MDVLAEAQGRGRRAARGRRGPRASPPAAPRRWPHSSRPSPRSPSRREVQARRPTRGRGARAPRRRARPRAGVEGPRRHARGRARAGRRRGQGALRGIVERERVTVLVNPDDLEIVPRGDRGREGLARRHRPLRGRGRAPCGARRLHRAHAGRRCRRAGRDQARARSARSSPPRSGAHDPRVAADKTFVFSVMDAALDAVDADCDEAALAIREADLHRRTGRVVDLIGLIVEATGLEAEVGEVCTIETGRGRPSVPAEVVGFRAGRTLLMALGDADGHRPGRARDRLGAAAAGQRLRCAARPRARRSRAPAGRHGPDPGHAVAPGRGRAARSAVAPAHRRARVLGRARPRRAGALRPRPAPRHLRRLRRRQVVAAGHDRPVDLGRDQRDLPGRRARSRGPGVHAARPRSRGPRALGGRRARPPTSRRWCA